MRPFAGHETHTMASTACGACGCCAVPGQTSFVASFQVRGSFARSTALYGAGSSVRYGARVCAGCVCWPQTGQPQHRWTPWCSRPAPCHTVERAIARSMSLARSAPQDAARTAAVLTDGVNAAWRKGDSGHVEAGETSCAQAIAAESAQERPRFGSGFRALGPSQRIVAFSWRCAACARTFCAQAPTKGQSLHPYRARDVAAVAESRRCIAESSRA